MAADAGDDSLYPIAVLIDELRNEDVQVFPVLELETSDPEIHFSVEAELHQETFYYRTRSRR